MGSKLLEKVTGISGENPENLHKVVSPEVRLISAIILHAIYDWLIHRESKDARLRRKAELARRWLFTPGESYATFDLYCHLLEADPEVIRKRIASLHDSNEIESVLEDPSPSSC